MQVTIELQVTAPNRAVGQDGAVADSPPGPAASPLDEALRRVGDRWSLLLIDALLAGPRRFTQLEAALTGMAPNILTKRLRHLEEQGVVVARPYSDRPPRFEYSLTATGSELAGALRLLAHWGAEAGQVGDAPHHALCGTPLEPRWWCPTCDEPVEPDADDLRYA